MSYKDKSVIVTGAASGLGKAIATAFTQASAHVVLADVNKIRLDETVSSLKGANADGTLNAVEADITSPDSVSKLIEAAKGPTGRLDVLINCAGVMDKMEPAGQVDLALWNRVININLTGTFLTTQSAINTMLAQSPPGGSILNIASVGGIKGGVAGAAYTASKHAVLGLTKNTAAFYAKKGIRCNAILPGGMETNITESVPGGPQNLDRENYGVVASNMAMQPGMCGVDEVAKLVVGVCASEVLNGACIAADNGWTAN